MIILIDRSFEKDAKRLPPDVQRKLKQLIQQIQQVNSFSQLGCEKLSGSQNAYRIRLGNYRIGIYKEDETVVLSRVLNRREIYRYFPKK
jgi:mRNA interferase RelE/StbE